MDELRFNGRVVVVTGAGGGSSPAPADEGSAHGIRVNAIAPRAYTRMSASHSDTLASVRTMPKEVMDEVNASMPPELCAPASAFLVHESCPLNGEILLIGMGSVARVAVVRGQGIAKSPLTAEDIAENLDEIMDLTHAHASESTRSVL
jgi:NAD(P)-dependent dehydrogenase (short-subunit alcohol dehydrogenase family)